MNRMILLLDWKIVQLLQKKAKIILLMNMSIYINDLCSFTFYVKKDFDIFLDIMIKTKWNVNIKLG